MASRRVENIIELSDSEEELRLPVPRLGLTSSVRSAASQVVDLGSPSPSEDEPGVLQLTAIAQCYHPGQMRQTLVLGQKGKMKTCS